MTAPLRLRSGRRVLETGCGTCRDSLHIAAALGDDGELQLQDLSRRMLELGRRRLEAARSAGGVRCRTEPVVGNALRLPFADHWFDAAVHLGGINLFGDVRAALAEMARVVRPGGRVVAGDEGLAP